MSADPTVLPAEVWRSYEPETADLTDLDSRVHVWRVGLDVVSNRMGENLSDDERARADRFARPDLRRRFMVARSALRAILADGAGISGAPKGYGLRLRYGPAGKPFLVDDPTLHFNVSHSEDMALIAVTRAGEIGIDIERERPINDMAGIARVVFDESERAAMLGCPPPARESVFYRIWTRKEALLKATGAGIAGLKDPDALSLSLATRAWQISTIPDLDGFAAALVRPRAVRGVRFWSWSDPIAAAGAWEPTASALPEPARAALEAR